MNIRPRRSLLDEKLQRPSALGSTPRRLDQIWLDKNENLDPQMIGLASRIMREISPLALATYPEAGELYRKLASWSAVSPESLLLTPGSDGAIRLAFEAFAEPGDCVVHTSPTFAMYQVYAQMFGVDAAEIKYAATEAGPVLDTASMIDVIRARAPKLVCLPNPDSPTGTILDPPLLKQILSECEAVGAVLLLDEAYHPFYDWTAVPWTKESKNLIVARTFAKAWGAAGLRIGYAVAHPETIRLLHKMRPMYEVGTVSVEFMSRMMDNAAEMTAAVARIEDGKRFFGEEMREMGFRVLPTYGNFIHVAFGARGPQIHAALAQQVLYRASFDQPCLAGYSRFTVAPREIMIQVADLIKSAVKDPK